jgi:2,3-bisphosphoglycerate-dependent phosphoglycerate mutase
MGDSAVPRGELILLRHGQSRYNLENLFTGWTDVELSDRGVEEAKRAGRLLAEAKLYPDRCYTSWLRRAIHTAQWALREMGWEQIEVCRDWRLNERHYGAWQGRNKEAVKAEVGEERFVQIRRGYEVPPPALERDDPRHPRFDPKYRTLDPALLPATESLADTRRRTLACFHERIAPELVRGRTVLVSAHGNSLRSLVMAIEGISPEAITGVEIPTGELICYTFDGTLERIDKRIIK